MRKERKEYYMTEKELRGVKSYDRITSTLGSSILQTRKKLNGIGESNGCEINSSGS